MKLGFLLYLVLLLIDGFVTWQATGSALLLALAPAGLMLYTAVVGRLGVVSEVFRFIAAILLVVLGAMQYGNRPFPIFITFLTLPHFLAATQCLWEMRHAPSLREKGAHPERLTVFSLAFYASCGLAFVLLKADDLRLAWVHQQLLASLVILLALVSWECSRVLSLRSGLTEDRMTTGGRFRRVLLALGIGLALLLTFLGALPPLVRFVCQFSSALQDRAKMDVNLGPPHRPQDRPENPTSSSQTGSSLTPTHFEETARSGRSRLPQRVELKLTEAPRAYLKFDDPAAALALTAGHPLYLRSLALTHYEHYQWLPASESGSWTTDAEDGQADGRITLSAPSSTALAYTVYAPDHDGYALPVLASLQSLDLPKVYTLPEDWLQIKETGNLKYHAQSENKLWSQLPPGNYRAGEASLEYLRVPDDRLGDTLRQLSDQIFAHHAAPGDAIPALARFLGNHYDYSTLVTNPHDLPPLENFLLDEHKGYCDLFATSAALLLRKAGIPTRVAFGYLGGVYDPASQIWTFQQRHAHAWVEMKIEGQGWVIGEFTPRDPTAANQTAQTVPLLSEFADAATPPPELPPSPRLEPPSFLGQVQNLFSDLSARWSAAIIGTLAALGLLMFWWRQRTATNTPQARARKEAAEREKEPAYFKEFLALCADLGHARLPGTTLRELETSLQQAPFYHPDFARMTQYHYQTRYEDAPLDRPLEKELLQTWRTVRKQHAAN